jgi:hypothetical protein
MASAATMTTLGQLGQQSMTDFEASPGRHIQALACDGQVTSIDLGRRSLSVVAEYGARVRVSAYFSEAESDRPGD